MPTPSDTQGKEFGSLPLAPQPAAGDTLSVRSKRKPHNQDAGYIAEKLFRGSHIVIYRSAEQGIDVGGDKYAVVCTKHGRIVSDSNLPGTRESMKYPAFCEDCMEGKAP